MINLILALAEEFVLLIEIVLLLVSIILILLLIFKLPLIVKLELEELTTVLMPILPLTSINRWGKVEELLLLALRIILEVEWIKKLFG